MISRMIFGGPMLFMAVCGFLMSYAFSPLYKSGWRRNLPVKIITMTALLGIITICEWEFVDFQTASTAWEVLFCIAAIFVFSLVGMKMTFFEALYCTVWAYLVTSIATQIVMPMTVVFGVENTAISFLLKSLPTYFVAAATGYYVVKRWIVGELQNNDRYLVNRQKLMISILVLCLYVLLSNYQVIFWFLGFVPEEMSKMVTIFRLILGFGAVSTLFLQNSLEKKQQTEQELDLIQQLWFRQQNQYRISQENIDLINRKCHDLKHQMSALRQLKDEKEIDEQIREMEHSVMIYDSVIKTGNPVLDTVLTEKSLFCEEHQINMTCMADGSYLEFVEKVDLYTMFGNALDNAVESVMKQKEKEKRVIQVSVFNEKNLLMIRVRNYCDEKVKLVNGIPTTTKMDKKYHGYGLKSIQHTAEKYGGGIVCQVLDKAFILQILLPIPQNVVL